MSLYPSFYVTVFSTKSKTLSFNEESVFISSSDVILLLAKQSYCNFVSLNRCRNCPSYSLLFSSSNLIRLGIIGIFIRLMSSQSFSSRYSIF